MSRSFEMLFFWYRSICVNSYYICCHFCVWYYCNAGRHIKKFFTVFISSTIYFYLIFRLDFKKLSDKVLYKNAFEIINEYIIIIYIKLNNIWELFQLVLPLLISKRAIPIKISKENNWFVTKVWRNFLYPNIYYYKIHDEVYQARRAAEEVG